MTEKNAVVLSDTTFKTEVLDHNAPVLVDFWATWCGPCQQIAPMIEELAGELKGSVKVCKLDVDQNQGTAGEYGVTSIPTLLVFKDGKEVERIVGALPKRVLKETVVKYA